MFENLNNAIIRFFIKRTHLHSNTLYAALFKNTDKENEFLVNEIKRARVESGCFSQDEYHKWLWTAPEKAEWRANITKLFEED